jgi:hypothetical protein
MKVVEVNDLPCYDVSMCKCMASLRSNLRFEWQIDHPS